MTTRLTRERNASRIFFAVSLSLAYSQSTPSAATAAASATSAPSHETLPFISPIFGDNMVLQRGKADALWGWSEPGDRVQVEIGSATASGIAGPDRRWQVSIQPPREPGSLYGQDRGTTNRRATQRDGGRCVVVRRPIEHGPSASLYAQWR